MLDNPVRSLWKWRRYPPVPRHGSAGSIPGSSNEQSSLGDEQVTTPLMDHLMKGNRKRLLIRNTAIVEDQDQWQRVSQSPQPQLIVGRPMLRDTLKRCSRSPTLRH